MSYGGEIAMLVEAAKLSGMTPKQVFEPLIENMARLVVDGAGGDTGMRDALVEIIRNDIDEAVARHDQLNSNRRPHPPADHRPSQG